MAGPMYFPVLSEEQNNPAIWGAAQRAAIAGQNQANFGRMLQNAQMGAQLPYAGQMAQANLANTQAQAPYINSQTALNNASLPYTGYKFMAPMLMAQARMAQAGIQNQNSYATLMKLPGAQQLIQNRPDLAQAFIQAMQNSAGMINSGAGFSGGGVSAPPQSSQNIPSNGNYNNPATLPVLPGGIPAQQQQLPQNGTTINQQQTNQLRNLLQPEIPQPSTDVQAVQQGTQNAYLDKNLTTQQRQAMTYENVVHNLLDKNQQQISDVSQFASLAGHAGQRAGQYAQALGLNTSPQYRNFEAFTTQTAPLLANEIRRAFQGQATDKETEMMNEISNPTAWDKDPQQVMQDFNTLVSNLGANGQEISKTPAQAMGTLKQNLANPVSFGNKNSNAMVKVQTPDGKLWNIPASKLNVAIQRGAKQI